MPFSQASWMPSSTLFQGEREVIMSAFENFVGEPLRHRRFDLAWYRVSQLLHQRTNGGFDQLYMNAAKVLKPKVKLPASSQFSERDIAELVANLHQDGYN